MYTHMYEHGDQQEVWLPWKVLQGESVVTPNPFKIPRDYWEIQVKADPEHSKKIIKIKRRKRAVKTTQMHEIHEEDPYWLSCISLNLSVIICGSEGYTDDC